MASVIPITPMPIHFASANERIVRHMTVANMEFHIVNFTSPAALKPPDSGPENGWTMAEKISWMIIKKRIINSKI